MVKNITQEYLLIQSVCQFMFSKKVSWGVIFHRGVRVHQNSQIGKKKCELELHFSQPSNYFMCWLVVFKAMNRRIPKEFLNILERKWGDSLGNLLSFIKNMLNMELKLMLILLMEFEYIINSWTLQEISWVPCDLGWLWISQTVSNTKMFRYFSTGEKNLSQTLMASEYWEALE